MVNIIRSRELLALLLCLVPALAAALSSDREQPIHIKADRVSLDERRGVSHYTGNVRLTQGTLTILSDTMTVYQANRQLQRVVIDGDPARYTQMPDNAKQPVKARARQMVYRSQQGTLTLEGQAHVEQEGSTFSGQHIVYDIDKDQIQAQGGGQEQERVHVIIQPQKQPAE